MHFVHWNWSDAAHWLENLDSLSTRSYQRILSRIICNRAIVVQNLGAPQRRLGALGQGT
jgi:hypothetical protein